SEDILLLVVALSWFAKTAVNKELGLTLKTPLNRPIFAYLATTALATLDGYATGTVQGLGGFFYVLKYVEYFIVYFMVVNNLGDRPQVWRLVTASFLGVPFVLGALAAFSTRRRVVILGLLLAVVASPLTLTFLPTPVVNRLLYTFQPETGQATVKLGRVAFDPSTSARLISFQSA